MSNLTEKFDELQADLDAKHGALMDKLQEIIDALGTVADPTGALTDILNSLNDFRTEVDGRFAEVVAALSDLPGIHADTTAIKDALPGLAEDIDDIRTHVASADLHLEGIEGKQVEVFEKLEAIYDAELSIGVHAAALSDTIGLKPEADPNIFVMMQQGLAKLDLLIQAMGVWQNAADGTVLALLYDISRYAPCMCGTIAPDALTCTAPYNSYGGALLPWALISGESVLVARFPDPPPSGITFGATFGLGADDTELLCGDWSEWNVYVESDQSNYADGAIGHEFERFPTNQWRHLDGSGSLAFAVRGQGWIKVHLCRVTDFTTSPIPVGECVRYEAAGTEGDSYYIDVPSYPTGYTMTFSTPANLVDGNGTSHGPLNYGVAWVIPTDVGPGPWHVTLGYTGDPSSGSFLNICNPTPEV